MRFWIGVLLGIFAFYSCEENSIHEGYSITESGLNYKINTIGEPNVTIHDSDVVGFNYSVYTLNDSLIHKSTKTILYTEKQDTGLCEILGLLALEDSASVVLSNHKLTSLYPIKVKGNIKLCITPISIIPFSDWAFYQKYPELAIDLEIEEQVILQQYLRGFKTDSIQYSRGVFIIQQVAGIGALPEKGNELVVHYSVSNMKGELLDSTRDRDEPFSYFIGEKDQVLEGFDIGVRQMNQGEKAVLIIPSTRAFGSNGSSSGIVGGFQTLIYSVEIIAIHP